MSKVKVGVKVGDKVLVVKPGYTYSSFDRMFTKLGFNNTEINEEFERGLIATVFAVEVHPTFSDTTLLALEAQDGSQCLMDTKGVVKISTEISSDEEFDIIRQFCDEVLSSQGISDKDIFKHLLKKSCK